MKQLGRKPVTSTIASPSRATRVSGDYHADDFAPDGSAIFRQSPQEKVPELRSWSTDRTLFALIRSGQETGLQPRYCLLSFCLYPEFTSIKRYLAEREGPRNLPGRPFLPRLQPPRSRATRMQASRRSSARAVSTIARATTMPPTHNAARAWPLS